MEGMTDRLAEIAQTVAHEGFAVVREPEMRAVLQPAGLTDWDCFAQSWDDLGVDAYMAEAGVIAAVASPVFVPGPRGLSESPTSRITKAATTTRSMAGSSAGSIR